MCKKDEENENGKILTKKSITTESISGKQEINIPQDFISLLR